MDKDLKIHIKAILSLIALFAIIGSIYYIIFG